MLQQDDFNATLRLLNKLPRVAEGLGYCAQMDSASTLYDTCLANCNADSACLAFHVQPDQKECCLYKRFVDDETFAVLGVAFYSLPQCEKCASGSYKQGRTCLQYDTPPLISGGLDARLVQIPLSTPVDTMLLSLEASVEAGFGPIVFDLAEKDVRLRVTAEGKVLLVAALQSPISITATIIVRDNRTTCTVPNDEGLPVTTSGPCEARLVLTIRVAAFLRCPRAINTYIALNETTAGVTWDEPELPTYLQDLNVTRDLGDTNSEIAPFHYGVGRHRITYATTEPLSLGGRIECAFELVVRRGYAVGVASVGTKVTTGQVFDFLAVELGETNQGARLPVIIGDIAAGPFSLGLIAPRGAPFAVTPTVRLDGTGTGEVPAAKKYCPFRSTLQITVNISLLLYGTSIFL